MFYLSQVLNAKVRDSADHYVGRVKDVLVRPIAGEYSPVTYIEIRQRRGCNIFIPINNVSGLTREHVDLKTVFNPNADGVCESPPDTHILLAHEIVDQQIVDTNGARVVRVNDLRIGNIDNILAVVGIDISFKGILRRLGLDFLDFLNLLSVKLIDWRDAQPIKGFLKLKILSKDMQKLHPADLANIIENLGVKHGSHLVRSLDSNAAAKALEEVDPDLQKVLIKYLGPELASDILANMPEEEVADLLQTMSRDDARVFLSYVKNTNKANRVENLIKYEKDVAGGMMTMDFVSVGPEWTVEQTEREIKKRSPSLRSMLYVYVVDGEGKFLGSVSLRWIIVSPGKTKMGELIKKIPRGSHIHPDDEVDHIMKVMTKYDLYTAAVVDDENNLVGIVTIDDVMRHLVPNA
ncbi:MAG TPA: CBS domain-containing protein [Candidatus Magasanikbacteria bacterium]|nr:CBS domain-containing protein [Candidatus Magasanikbacteria bacterium]